MARYKIELEFETEVYADAYTEFVNVMKSTSQPANVSFFKADWHYWRKLEKEALESEHLARKDTVWTRFARRIVRAGSS